MNLLKLLNIMLSMFKNPFNNISLVFINNINNEKKLNFIIKGKNSINGGKWNLCNF